MCVARVVVVDMATSAHGHGDTLGVPKFGEVSSLSPQAAATKYAPLIDSSRGRAMSKPGGAGDGLILLRCIILLQRVLARCLR